MIPIWMPWPDYRLSTNGRDRLSWRTLRRLTKTHKTFAGQALMVLPPAEKRRDWSELLWPRWEATPPITRNRDDDGFASAVKAYRDVIADVIGIDDHRFRALPVIWLPASRRHQGVYVSWGAIP